MIKTFSGRALCKVIRFTHARNSAMPTEVTLSSLSHVLYRNDNKTNVIYLRIKSISRKKKVQRIDLHLIFANIFLIYKDFERSNKQDTVRDKFCAQTNRHRHTFLYQMTKHLAHPTLANILPCTNLALARVSTWNTAAISNYLHRHYINRDG